jgi:ClpP class serine protease
VNVFTYYALVQNEVEKLLALETRLSSLPAPIAKPSLSRQVMSKAAVIPVNGILVPRDNILTAFGYGVALTGLERELNVAANDPSIERIVLNFDSPGGITTGINELSATIKAVSTNKPVIAYVSGMACSAAYRMASACNEIICDAMALLGSIGVVGVFYPKNSNEIEIVSSNAPDKRPDATTDQGRSVILQVLDDLEAQFHGAITGNRSVLTVGSLKAMRGGIMVGSRAVEKGLADRLGSLQSVLSEPLSIDQRFPAPLAPAKSPIPNATNAQTEAIAGRMP